MTILVLGASGFIGSWVARALASSGERVVAFCRPASNPWRLAAARGLHIQMATDDEWPSAIAFLRPTTIVSLDWAGVAGASRNDDSQWRNLDRQVKTIQAAAAAGTRRFVGIGSQAEYGPHDAVITESASCEPVTEYGRAKLAAMESSRAQCTTSGLEWIWGRVFSVYGPLDNGHWLLPLVGAALLDHRDISLTSGEQRWSYLYASDAASAIVRLALSSDAHGIINVGNPDAPRLRDAIEEFAIHFSTGSSHLHFGAREFEQNAVMWLQPDVSKLLQLGWSPAVSLRDGLEFTASWLKGELVPDPYSDQTIPLASSV